LYDHTLKYSFQLYAVGHGHLMAIFQNKTSKPAPPLWISLAVMVTTGTVICAKLLKKMVLFHIAAIGWISPQTGYKIQGSTSTQN